MIIQVIGLPCSGKSTLIKAYIKNRSDIIHLDINDFSIVDSTKSREAAYKKAIRRSSQDVLAESACGVYLRGSEVVRLETDLETVYNRTVERDGVLDEDYISLLKHQMQPAKYTVKDTSAFKKLIDKLLDR